MVPMMMMLSGPGMKDNDVDGDDDGVGNFTWHEGEPSCKCPFLGRWLNHQVPLKLLIIEEEKI